MISMSALLMILGFSSICELTNFLYFSQLVLLDVNRQGEFFRSDVGLAQAGAGPESLSDTFFII